MELWTGSFKSNTYSMVYGDIAVNMFPPNVTGYSTKVKVAFRGFASLLQGIFSPKMEFDILVESNKKLSMQIGSAKIVFETKGEIKPDTTVVVGSYTATSGSYVSKGELFLRKDSAFPNEDRPSECSFM